MSSVRDIVRAAILGHRRLSFTYRGRPRVVNPMRLGRSTKGTWQLRAVQVGGESDRSHSPPGDRGVPKLFELTQMTDVVMLDAEFPVPRQYERHDAAFVETDVEL
jgi:WYL domain